MPFAYGRHPSSYHRDTFFTAATPAPAPHHPHPPPQHGLPYQHHPHQSQFFYPPPPIPGNNLQGAPRPYNGAGTAPPVPSGTNKERKSSVKTKLKSEALKLAQMKEFCQNTLFDPCGDKPAKNGGGGLASTGNGNPYRRPINKVQPVKNTSAGGNGGRVVGPNPYKPPPPLPPTNAPPPDRSGSGIKSVGLVQCFDARPPVVKKLSPPQRSEFPPEPPLSAPPLPPPPPEPPLTPPLPARLADRLAEDWETASCLGSPINNVSPMQTSSLPSPCSTPPQPPPASDPLGPPQKTLKPQPVPLAKPELLTKPLAQAASTSGREGKVVKSVPAVTSEPVVEILEQPRGCMEFKSAPIDDGTQDQVCLWELSCKPRGCHFPLIGLRQT